MTIFSRFGRLWGLGILLILFALGENYVLTTGVGITFNQGGTLNHTQGGRLLPEAELSDPIYDSLPGMSDLRYKVRWLGIPFSFRMRTTEFGKWRLTFEAPIISFGIRMRARGDTNAPGLPETDGLTLLGSLHKADPNVAILFITSRDSESDIVAALKRGADDYLVKPACKAETLARISSVLRRHSPLQATDPC